VDPLNWELNLRTCVKDISFRDENIHCFLFNILNFCSLVVKYAT
jgi:hypothetical protein